MEKKTVKRRRRVKVFLQRRERLTGERDYGTGWIRRGPREGGSEVPYRVSSVEESPNRTTETLLREDKSSIITKEGVRDTMPTTQNDTLNETGRTILTYTEGTQTRRRTYRLPGGRKTRVFWFGVRSRSRSGDLI